MTTDTTEKGLETLITRHLTGQDRLAAVAGDQVTETPGDLAAAKAIGSGCIAGHPGDFDRASAIGVPQFQNSLLAVADRCIRNSIASFRGFYRCSERGLSGTVVILFQQHTPARYASPVEDEKDNNMSSKLAEKTCTACKGAEAPLKGDALDTLRDQLDEGWTVVDEHHLEKTFKFDDFRQALDFTNRVGSIAEDQGHHPDIYLTYGKVKLQIWTHKIDGLTESDFIFAAKADDAG